MNEMRVMNQSGDEKIEWDPDDPKSTAKAEKAFEKLKKKGYDFFEVAETKGKQVKKFSKDIGKLIAAPGRAKSSAQRKGGKAMAGGPLAERGAGLGGIPAGMVESARRELSRR